MKKGLIIFAGLVILVKVHAQTVTDFDGNVYNTVTIGTQVWMKENLKVTRYNNGDSIPKVINDTIWENQTAGAYCDFENFAANSVIYGKLYNWFTVNDNRGIAPSGWHIPTDEDWTLLTNALGGESISGGKLKDTGTVYWISPNMGATNESGFSGLPGGNRYDDGRFGGIRDDANFWSSTAFDINYAKIRSLTYSLPSVSNTSFLKKKRVISTLC